MARKTLVLLIASLFITTLLTSCNDKITDPASISESSGSESHGSGVFTSDAISSDEESSTAESTAESTASVTSSVNSSTGSSAASSAESSVASSSAPSSTPVSSVSSQSSSSASTISAINYFLAGSWNGYIVDDEEYEMTLVSGTQTWYAATVELTTTNRDELYDGHWYKVTEGNWNNSYGIDNYVQQPAPVKKDLNDNPIGLGSVWIDENLTLTVMFDTSTLTIYDNADGKTLPQP